MADPGFEELAPNEVAAMRWQAVEGFNSFPGLSPMARRVGIALICTMDSKTRECFPSELRLAAQLGVHISAVKKAKLELRKAGLVDWLNPYGPRHLSRYLFNWSRLMETRDEASDRAKVAVQLRAATRRQSTLQGTYDRTFNSTLQGTLEPVSDHFQGTRTARQSTQTALQSTLQGSPKVPYRVLELSHELPSLDMTQQSTASSDAARDASRGAAQGKGDEKKSIVQPSRQPSLKVVKKEALEKVRKRFEISQPRLKDVFGEDAEVMGVLEYLCPDIQHCAALFLGKTGLNSARQFILNAQSNPERALNFAQAIVTCNPPAPEVQQVSHG